MSTIGSSIPRSTSQMVSNQLLSSLRRIQAEMLEQQQAITTGYGVARPSSAPEKTAAIQLLRQQVIAREQHDQNLNHALSLLNFADSSLSDVNSILLEAQGIAATEANFTSNADTRANQATVVQAQIEAIIFAANRQFQGISIFGGNAGPASGENVFEEFLGGVRYTGSQQLNLQGDYGLSDFIDFNSNGSDAFGALSARVQGSVDLNPVASAGTRIKDIEGAQEVGFRKGSVNITVDGSSVTLDLSTINTLGDVVTRINEEINNIDPTAGAVALSAVGFDLTANAGHTITIADIQAGQTAADLGIDLTATATTVNGSDLGIQLTRHSSLADLGATVDFASGLSITQGATTKVADFSSANTIEDMMNVIEQLNLGLRMVINEDKNGIDLISEISGLELAIGENGGTTGTDLGIRSFHGDTELSALRHGLGVTGKQGEDDFTVQMHDGTTFNVNIDGATTVSEVLTIISTAATTAGLTVGAVGAGGTDFNIGFATNGNGIVFEDNTAGANDFRVTQLNTSLAATHLGIYKNAGAGTALNGDDNAKVRVEGMLTHLINLRDSLLSDDTLGITLAGGGIEDDIDVLTRVRADVGVRAGQMQRALDRSSEMHLTEQEMLSQLRDADLTEVITRFTQLQQQLQASLQAGAANLQLSLLDFLG